MHESHGMALGISREQIFCSRKMELASLRILEVAAMPRSFQQPIHLLGHHFGVRTLRCGNESILIYLSITVAPEIISKEDATYGADIWSLGCTIVELLTGQAPYWKFGADVALYRMVNDPHPPMPKEISGVCISTFDVNVVLNFPSTKNLEAFLKGCFIRDAVQRPTATNLLNSDWIRSIWVEPL